MSGPTRHGVVVSAKDKARVRRPGIACAGLAVSMIVVMTLLGGCSRPAAPASGAPLATSGSASDAVATEPAPTLQTRNAFSAGGISFSVPASWHTEVIDQWFHYEHLLGYAGDGAWALACPAGAAQGQFNTCVVKTTLAPNTVVVRVSEWNGPPTPAGAVKWALTSGTDASALTIGGLPAAVQVLSPSDPDTQELLWTISDPGGDPNRAYTISAVMRGPDVAAMRVELDEVVRSVVINPKDAPAQ